MRRNHFDSSMLQILIQSIAVIRFVTDQILRFRLQHVEVELSCTNVTS
jgi:hypothetical protein